MGFVCFELFTVRVSALRNPWDVPTLNPNCNLNPYPNRILTSTILSVNFNGARMSQGFRIARTQLSVWTFFYVYFNSVIGVSIGVPSNYLCSNPQTCSIINRIFNALPLKSLPRRFQYVYAHSWHSLNQLHEVDLECFIVCNNE